MSPSCFSPHHHLSSLVSFLSSTVLSPFSPHCLVVFPLCFLFFFSSVLFCSPQLISVFTPYIPLSLCLFFFLLSLLSRPFFPLVSSFFSPFYSQNCMRFFFNENVRDHYCSGNGREIVAVKRSP